MKKNNNLQDDLLKSARHINSFRNIKAVKILFHAAVGSIFVLTGFLISLLFFKENALFLKHYIAIINVLNYTINMIIILCVGYLLYGKKEVTICSNCRSILVHNNRFPIEYFLGNVSHSICDVCAGVIHNVWSPGVKEKILTGKMLDDINKSKGEIKLGRLLLDMGYITEKQLMEALCIQEKFPNLQLGDILLEKSILNSQDLKDALDEQKNLKHISNNIKETLQNGKIN